MSKFWFSVAVVAAVGLAMISTGFKPQKQVSFQDLETECRYSQAEEAQINKPVNEDRFTFEGGFLVNSTESDLSYSYSQKGDRIILNVEAEEKDRSETFVDTCLGYVKYKASTDKISEGTYTVEIRHQGEKAEKKIVEIR
ncbi:MAG: hypothetical protein ABEJ93_01970 [Candidatus Nanohalobium sp.]